MPWRASAAMLVDRFDASHTNTPSRPASRRYAVVVAEWAARVARSASTAGKREALATSCWAAPYHSAAAISAIALVPLEKFVRAPPIGSRLMVPFACSVPRPDRGRPDELL